MKPKQPKIRYQCSKPVLAGREEEYVREAVASGWISGAGPYIGRFERMVSEYLGLEDGIAVSSGTAALHLALLSLGLGEGDEVIVPSFTFVACANAVRYCGAVPVLADCDRSSWNLTADSLKAAVTPRTRAVLLVHLYGLPADVDPILEFCEAENLLLIEDCAQSFGARYKGRSAGSYGDAAAFSFYGNKVISTGEGGMVFVRDAENRERARRMRSQGMDPARHHWYPTTGFNYRMTNVAAAIGCGQIEMADYHVQERRRIGRRYLENLKGIETRDLVQLPVQPPGRERVFWLFGLVLKTRDPQARDRVIQSLLGEEGIQSRPFYIPLHRLPMYASAQAFPNADFVGSNGIALPTYSGLADADIDLVSKAVERAVREA